MTVNAHKGEVALDLAGDEVVLRCHWDAYARLLDIWGEDFSPEAETMGRQPARLAESVAVLSGGKVSAADVAAASPPVAAVVAAVQKCWMVAWFGPAAARDAEGEEAGPGAGAGDPPAPARGTGSARTAASA